MAEFADGLVLVRDPTSDSRTGRGYRGPRNAWNIHSALSTWTSNVDQKASFALAIESAILIAAAGFTQKGSLFGSLERRIEFCTYVGGVALLVAAVICAGNVVKPRLRGREAKREWRSHYIYFGHVQARLAVTLKQAGVAQRAHQPAAQRERGIGAGVALARRESPHRGGIHLGLAVVLCAELPHTLAAMEAGWCSEWRATQIAQGTACLARADRQKVDQQLMADPATTAGWGERRFRAEVDKLANAADPAAAVARHTRAVGERHTSLRPAPDGMVRFSALLPLAEGVAVHAVLSLAADTARAAGDERARGQVMADTFLGAFRQTTKQVPVSPVAVQVTVSDATLLNLPGEAGDQPGWVSGAGVAGVPLPADLVRDLIARAHQHGLASLRRFYTSPTTGQLVAMDSTSRTFPAGLARFLEARDRTYRTLGATPRSGTATTSGPGPRAAPPPPTTVRASARAATTSSRQTAGGQEESAAPTGRTRSRPPPPTGHRHRSRAPGLPSPLDHASPLEIRLADFSSPPDHAPRRRSMPRWTTGLPGLRSRGATATPARSTSTSSHP